MREISLGQFLKYRTHCLCGSQLTTNFSYSTAKIGNATISPAGSYYLDKLKESIIFPFTIEFVKERVHFELISFLHSNSFVLRINNNATVAEFIKEKFSQDIQSQISINMNRGCSSHYCNYSYKLYSVNTIFDFSNYTVTTNVSSEHYKIVDKELLYEFYINSKNDTATIMCYSIGRYDRVPDLILPADKFLEYPFNAEFIINKVKTLLLFS